MDRVKQPFKPSQSYTLNPPTILDQDGKNPRCTTFDDMYFMPDSGYAEVDHVFLAGNGLPDAWRADNEQADTTRRSSTYTIVELGFGTGLNIFRAVSLWLALPETRHSCLHCITTEVQPLSTDQLATYASPHSPMDQKFLTAFLRWYPENLQGQYRFRHQRGARSVIIDLLVGDATPMLASLRLPRRGFDALFLDGFAPKKNPALWSPEVLASLARGSVPGRTRCATFTAARLVRDNLGGAGFAVERVPGIMGKRHITVGRFDPVGPLPPASGRYPTAHGPARHQLSKGAHVVVIGAGLAGCQTAYALSQRGFRVTVLERADKVAAGGSGNHQGALYTRITKAPTAVSSFYLRGFQFARQQLFSLGGSPKAAIYRPMPLLSLLADDEAIEAARALLARHRFSARFLEVIENAGKTWLANHLSAMISPPALCQKLLGGSPGGAGITVRLNTAVTQLTRAEQGWRVLTESMGKTEFVSADAVVIASSYEAETLWPLGYLGLKAIRGQVTYCDDRLLPERKGILTADRYLLPGLGGIATAGASYNLHSEETSLSIEDQADNLAAASTLLGQPLDEGCVVGGRVSFRGVSRDYLPIVGPVPDDDACREAFGYLSKDAKQPVDREAIPYHPGLFVSVGHGSRGLSSTPLAAEILAAAMAGEPAPVEEQVLHSLAPERFIFRQLMRGSP